MSDRPRDSDSQQFQQEYTDDDFLKAVERLELPTAKDISDEIGCAKSTAADRLRALEESSDVTSSEVGQAKVWRLTD